MVKISDCIEIWRPKYSAKPVSALVSVDKVKSFREEVYIYISQCPDWGGIWTIKKEKAMQYEKQLNGKDKKIWVYIIPMMDMTKVVQ